MTQLTKSQMAGAKKAAAEYFTNQAAGIARNMPDIISESEARRLAANLVTKANQVLEEKKANWNDIDKAQFVNDMLRIVTLGLDTGANEAYVIPYGNPGSGSMTLDIMESAKGLRKLVMSYPIADRKITDFRAYAVREGDHFRVRRTPGDDRWEYEEEVFGNGEVKGYVTIASYDDGTSSVMTHSLEDIAKRRSASKSPNSPAWTKWPVEMALAKATRRHCKDIGWAMPKQRQEAWEAAEESREPLDVTPKVELTPPDTRIQAQAPEPEARKIEVGNHPPQQANAPEAIVEPPTPYADENGEIPEPEQGSFDEDWMNL